MNKKSSNSGAGKGDSHNPRINPKKYYDDSNWQWRKKKKNKKKS